MNDILIKTNYRATRKQTFLEKLYMRHRMQLIRYATNMIDNFYAEDVVQDVFMSLLQQGYQFISEMVALKLLYISIHHRCIDLLRNNQIVNNYKKSYKKEEYSSQYDKLLTKEFFLTIESRIAILPPKCKQVFILKYRDERNSPEISKMLGLSVRTVENQVYIARNILRKHLNTYLIS